MDRIQRARMNESQWREERARRAAAKDQVALHPLTFRITTLPPEQAVDSLGSSAFPHRLVVVVMSFLGENRRPVHGPFTCASVPKTATTACVAIVRKVVAHGDGATRGLAGTFLPFVQLLHHFINGSCGVLVCADVWSGGVAHSGDTSILLSSLLRTSAFDFRGSVARRSVHSVGSLPQTFKHSKTIECQTELIFDCEQSHCIFISKPTGGTTGEVNLPSQPSQQRHIRRVHLWKSFC